MKGSMFLEAARGNLDEIRERRRDFHRHPELAFGEVRTAEKVAAYLEKLGLEVQSGVGETGVVGLLRCGGEGRTAALRADMDALPVQEKNEVSYASLNPGVMHACGHDGHTAILLEVARLLRAEGDGLRGNVKFIFQPAEEKVAGAKRMIEAGVLRDPDVDALFTLHLAPNFPQGSMWVKSGHLTISSADFEVMLKGKGGHVAMPDQVVDPIGMAGALITSSQSLMLRRVPAGETMVFGFGTIAGGTKDNIIPDQVRLSGTIRTTSPDKRERAIEAFERIVQATVAAVGGGYELRIHDRTPSVYNDEALVGLLLSAGGTVLGKENVHALTVVFPAGDDAAYFHQRVPGVYWFLGIRNEGEGFDKPLHNPYFDFDEHVLALGAAVQAQVVRDYLLGEGQS